ncbi:MAG: ComEC/Rec2 family competence protein [Elusimicrobia bacterium]|nr:ComEC/Rec2 family competence protein [Elusimicrobiota bacterium]
MHPSHFRRPLFWVLVSYILLLCLLKSWGFFDRLPPLDVAHHAPLSFVELKGAVSDFPRQRAGRLEFPLQATSLNGEKATGMVWVQAQGNVSLFWRDSVTLTGNLERIPRTNFWRKGARSLLRVNSPKFVAIDISSRSSALQSVFLIRSRLLKIFFDSFPPDRAGILCGVVLGEKSSIPRELNQAFRDSGTMHLLVASGSNVTFVTGLMFLLASWVGLRRKPALLLGVCAAGFYTLCAGADAPLLRAYAMTLAGCLGYLLDRDSGIFQGLLLALATLLIVSPESLFQVGFQMSFLAALSLVIVFSHWKIPSEWPRSFRYLAALFVASLAAESALFPIMANTFHRISLVGIFSNMVVVPLTEVLMGMGFLLFILAGLPGTSLFHAGVALTDLFLRLVEFSVRFFAGIPFSSISTSGIGTGWSLMYYGVAASLWVFPQAALRWKFLGTGLLFSALAFSMAWVLPSRPEVILLGNFSPLSFLFKEPGGSTFLVGSGGPASRVAQNLSHWGTKELKGIFLPSLQKREEKLVEDLAEIIPIRALYTPPTTVRGHALDRFQETLKTKNILWLQGWPSVVSLGEAQITGDFEKGFSGWPERDRILWTVSWKNCRYTQFDIMPSRNLNECP